MIEKILSLDSSWEVLKASKLPLLIYGTGNGADAVIDELNRLGIEISGVFASDGFVRKRTFRGFEVKSLSQAENEFDEFSVAVCFASSIPEVMYNILSVAEKHFSIIPVVPVYGKNIFNRMFVSNNADQFEKAYSLMADEESRRVFSLACESMFTGKAELFTSFDSHKDEVFRSFFSLTDSEDYLDCGAYRGDTITEFLSYTDGKYSSITAVEPDLKSFAKLGANTKSLSNTVLINKCISDREGTVMFNGGGGRQSAVSDSGYSVKCTTVDSLSKQTAFTYIKADVEGFEKELLTGGREFISNYRPKLNIAAYHRSEDIFLLPQLINEINPDYRIYLRKHPYIPCWDLNLYCI